MLRCLFSFRYAALGYGISIPRLFSALCKVRNLGGSIGIAAIATLVTQREQFHSNRLGEAISLYNLATEQRLEQLTQFFASRGADLSTAQNQAIATITNTVRREAYVMAFN